MNNRTVNHLEFDERRSIWKLADGQTVPYSDGRRTEAYLTKVLGTAADLSSASHELQEHILDWVTEYHLSRKRAQLLSGFQFDRRLKALEVGCGCGAITRFLGETFDDVVAVEGSLERAAIARLRTRDQSNVSIICAPFQAIEFKETFDIIFCIGVFEYAGAFIDADDPYDFVLEYFGRVLSPNGTLVLAIENQFGLKYFCSSREDHTGIRYDGIEGYHRLPGHARTFGYGELKERILKRFPKCDFYYPFPDYKTPSCIISEELLDKVDVGELVAEFVWPPDSVNAKAPFDVGLALAEIARNKMIPFFANSFLVVASKADSSVGRDWLGILYSTARRRPEFQTCTNIVADGDRVHVVKRLLSGEESAGVGKLRLKPSSHPWMEGHSLQFELTRRLHGEGNTLEDILDPTVPWFRKLQELSEERDGVSWVDGKYLDAIWRNTFVHGDDVTFIDLEWEWAERLRLSYVVIRAFFDFFRDVRGRKSLRLHTGHGSLYGLIRRAARFYGLRISCGDFRYFIVTESEVNHPLPGDKTRRLWRVFTLAWQLCDSPASRFPANVRRRVVWWLNKLRKLMRIAKRARHGGQRG